jgi:hypothetical protein
MADSVVTTYGTAAVSRAKLQGGENRRGIAGDSRPLLLTMGAD